MIKARSTPASLAFMATIKRDRFHQSRKTKFYVIYITVMLLSSYNNFFRKLTKLPHLDVSWGNMQNIRPVMAQKVC